MNNTTTNTSQVALTYEQYKIPNREELSVIYLQDGTIANSVNHKNGNFSFAPKQESMASTNIMASLYYVPCNYEKCRTCYYLEFKTVDGKNNTRIRQNCFDKEECIACVSSCLKQLNQLIKNNPTGKTMIMQTEDYRFNVTTENIDQVIKQFNDSLPDSFPEKNNYQLSLPQQNSIIQSKMITPACIAMAIFFAFGIKYKYFTR